MDALPALGRRIFEVVEATSQIYANLLSEPSRASAIHATKHETFSYGPHERQCLDFYYPSESAPSPPKNKTRPVLVFAYGGGFVAGDKVVPFIPDELVYRNLGYFFAENLGFDAVILDYRLLSHGAVFPSGGEDVGGVLKWIEQKYGGRSEQSPGREVYLMGTSAGGVHVATWLFGAEFRDQRNSLIAGKGGIKLSGVIIHGAPWNWDHSGDGPLRDILRQYYGSEENIKRYEPAALARTESQSDGAIPMGDWPRLLVLVSELDPEDLMVQSARDFVKEWASKGGRIEMNVLTGHNHISPPLALGTGIKREEKWGFDVAEWASK